MALHLALFYMSQENDARRIRIYVYVCVYFEFGTVLNAAPTISHQPFYISVIENNVPSTTYSVCFATDFDFLFC